MERMMTCEKEITLYQTKVEKENPLFSSLSIQTYVEYAKKHHLVTQYFPILDCGFIVYNDETIYLTAEGESTRLSINPMSA